MQIMPSGAGGWNKSASEIKRLLDSVSDQVHTLRSEAFIGPKGVYAFRTFGGSQSVLEVLGPAMEANRIQAGVIRMGRRGEGYGLGRLGLFEGASGARC